MGMFNVNTYNGLFNDLLLWVVASELIDDSMSTIHPAWGSLFVLFWLFFMFFKINNLTSFLLIAEAAMVTIVFCYITAAPFFVQSIVADLLNVLNASAMEAIVGIVVVFCYHGSWKNKKNSDTAVVESNLYNTISVLNPHKKNIIRVNCYRLVPKLWFFRRSLDLICPPWVAAIVVIAVIVFIFYSTNGMVPGRYAIPTWTLSVKINHDFIGNFSCQTSGFSKKMITTGSEWFGGLIEKKVRTSNTAPNSSGVENLAPAIHFIRAPYNIPVLTGYNSEMVGQFINTWRTDYFSIFNHKQFSPYMNSREVQVSQLGLAAAADQASLLTNLYKDSNYNIFNSAIETIQLSMLYSTANITNTGIYPLLSSRLEHTQTSNLTFNNQLSDFKRGKIYVRKPVGVNITYHGHACRGVYPTNYSLSKPISSSTAESAELFIRQFFQSTARSRRNRFYINNKAPRGASTAKIGQGFDIIGTIRSDTTNWSNKSFVAPMMNYSNLLPWYESASTCDDILETGDDIPQHKLFSPYAKKQLVTDWWEQEDVVVDYLYDIVEHNLAVTAVGSSIFNTENTLNNIILEKTIKTAALHRRTDTPGWKQPRLISLYGTSVMSDTSAGMYTSKKRPLVSARPDILIDKQHNSYNIDSGSITDQENKLVMRRVLSYIKDHEFNIEFDFTINKHKDNFTKSSYNKSSIYTAKDRAVKNKRRRSPLKNINPIMRATRHINRRSELSDLKSVVNSRMFRPVEDILNSSFSNLYVDSNKMSYSTIPPNYSRFKSLIGQASNIVHSVDSRNMPLYLSKTPFTQQIKSVKSVTDYGKLSVTSDDETDIEMLRVYSEKPNTIYGLVWDEFISNAFGTNLKFISFGSDYFESSKSNNRKLTHAQSVHSLIQNAQLPDLRYNLSINDEITAQIKYNLVLPLFGIQPTATHQRSNYLSNVTHKTSRFRKLRSDLINHRSIRRQSKLYSNRQLKYSDAFPGQYRLQTPNLLKIPYLRKFITTHDYADYWQNSLPIINYSYNRKSNRNHRRFSRLDSAVPKYDDYGDSFDRISGAHTGVHLKFNDVRGYSSLKSDQSDIGLQLVANTRFVSEKSTDELLPSYARNSESYNLAHEDALSVIKSVTPGIRNWGTYRSKIKPINRMLEHAGGGRPIVVLDGVSKKSDNTINRYPKYINADFTDRSRSYSRYTNPLVQLIRSKSINLENLVISRNAKVARRLYLNTNTEARLFGKSYNSKSLDESMLLNSNIFNKVTRNNRSDNKISYINTWSSQGYLPNFEISYTNNSNNVNRDDYSNLSNVSYVTEKWMTPDFYRITNTSLPGRYTRGYYTLFSNNPWELHLTNSLSSHSLPNNPIVSILPDYTQTEKIVQQIPSALSLQAYRTLSPLFIELLGVIYHLTCVYNPQQLSVFSVGYKSTIKLEPTQIYLYPLMSVIKGFYWWAYAFLNSVVLF